jgi:sulfonate transport system permease protein
MIMATEKQNRPFRASDTRLRGAAPLRGLLPLIVGLILWQIFASPKSPYFPPPLSWLQGLQTLQASGKLMPAFTTTIASFLAGLALSVLIGSIMGLLLGRSAALDRMLGPILEFGRTMPAGALVPIAVLIMGYTESMTLFVVILTSFWPILLNVRSAAKGISRDRLDAARVLRLSWWDTQRKIVFPSVLPAIQLGTQIAAPVVLIIVLLVEILTQVSGIGREIAVAQATFRSSTVFGLVMLTGILGLLVNWGISWIGRLTRIYEPSLSGDSP